MSKSTSTNMAVVSILKFSVKYTVSRSEKYHLVDLLLNLLVHHPIHDHHHLDFLVNLLVHDPTHDHLQAKCITIPTTTTCCCRGFSAKPNLPPLLQPLILTPVKALAARQLGICVFLSYLTFYISDILSVLCQCRPSGSSSNMIILMVISLIVGQ